MYEVVEKKPVVADGSVSCLASTATYDLPTPYMHEYFQKGIDSLSVVTGDIPAEFLTGLPESSCTLGSFEASPTVLIVVDIIYYWAFTARIGHVESTATEDPEAPCPTCGLRVHTERPAPGPPDVPGFVTAENVPGTAIVEANPGVPTDSATSYAGASRAGVQPTASNPQEVDPAAPKPGGVETPVSEDQPGEFTPIGGDTNPTPADNSRPTATSGRPNVTFNIGRIEQTVTIDPATTNAPPVLTATIGGQTTILTPQGPAPSGGNAPSAGDSVLTFVVGPTRVIVNPATTTQVTALTVNVGGSVTVVAPLPTVTPSAAAVAGNLGSLLAPSAETRPAAAAAGNLGSVIAEITRAGAASQQAGPSAVGQVQGNQAAAPSRNIVVGSNTFVLPSAPSAPIVIGGQTLAPGGPAVVVDNIPVSLAPSATAIVVGGRTSPLPQVASPVAAPPSIAAPPPVIPIGGNTFTPNAATQYYLTPGATLTPGGVATLSGTVISLGPSASYVVIDGSTQPLARPVPAPTAAPARAPAPVPAPTLTFGGSTFSAVPGSFIEVGGQPLAPGSAVTVNGNTISLDSSGSNVVLNGVTQPLAAQATTPPILTFAGGSFTPSVGTSYIISGQTLRPGAAVTVGGTTISLAPSATAVVINGVAQPLAPQATAPPVLTVAGNTFAPSVGSSFVIAGQTLRPGVAITVDGTTISLAPSASAVVINGATQTLRAGAVTPAAAVTIAGSTYTASAGAPLVVDGQTLTPGGVIIVSGTTVSLSPSASEVIVNGVTQVLRASPVVTPRPVLTVGGQTYSVGSSSGQLFVIDRQTLAPGGVITVSGSTISLGPSAAFVVVNDATQVLVESAVITAAPVLTVAGQTFTASGGSFVIAGQTLRPGNVLTVDGTTISLGPSASIAVVNGATQTLSLAPVITYPPILTVDGQVFTATSGTFVVDGQTLTPGGVIVADGTTISLGPSASIAVVNGVTETLVFSPTITPAPVLSVDGQAFTATSGTFVIDGQTLTPGGVFTVDGTVISLSPSATIAVVNGVTTTLAYAPMITSPPTLTIAGEVYTATSGSFVIDGQTLTPGGVLTVDGTVVSLGPSATIAVINGITSTLAYPPTITSPPTLTIAGQVYTATSGTFVIGTQTLTPGAILTISGTTVSLGPSASFAIVNGVISTLVSPPTITAPPFLTIGNTVYTATVNGAGTTYVIAGQTLTPGGAITVDGTRISLAASATALVVNGRTTSLSPATAVITLPPLLTIGPSTYTALPGGGTTFVIAGQTLTPGGVIVVDGTTISLSPGATALVVNGRTTALFPATSTRANTAMTTSTSARPGESVGSASASATKTGAAAGRAGKGAVWTSVLAGVMATVVLAVAGWL